MQKKARFSCFLGNLFDHYDTALFALLAPYIAKDFFPSDTPLIQLFKAYAILPLGMIARPFGAWFFGRLADIRGKGVTLFYTLFFMGLISLLMALLPTSHDIGPLAAVILLALRLLQNFFTAGETVPGSVFILERTEESRRNFFSSLYSCSTLGGILLASAFVSLLSYFNAVETGWRFLFLLGAGTAFVGVQLRRRTHQEIENYPKGLTKTHDKEHWLYSWKARKTVLKIALFTGFSYSTYQIAIIFSAGFVPTISSVSLEQMSLLTTGLLIFDMLLLPFMGFYITKERQETWMKTATLAAAFGGPLLFSLLPLGSYSDVALVRFCFVLIGMAFSFSLGAWCFDQEKSPHRTEVLSIANALGSQTIGIWMGPLTLYLYEKSGSILLCSLPYSCTALVTLSVLLLAARPREVILEKLS